MDFVGVFVKECLFFTGDGEIEPVEVFEGLAKLLVLPVGFTVDIFLGRSVELLDKLVRFL